MIVVDVETTGTNPLKHSLIDIGAVDFSNASNQFYGQCRIFQNAELSLYALELTGMAVEKLNDINKPTVEELVEEFIEWTKPIKDKTIAGQNP
ncbi:MAG: exonuclease domain-containing protein, partial [Candidatus Omnitrophica bacterium]|nr:exonuclease domain-containing protein [Candidatus Omnitrophota bacterium]